MNIFQTLMHVLCVFSGVAKTIFEDIYAMLDITDGADWAYILRANMSGKHGDKMMIRSPMEEDPLMMTRLAAEKV